MSEERTDSFDEEPAFDDGEWDRRVLCSDGNCIGVIGPDGRCKECGKAHEGALPDDKSPPAKAPPLSSPADEAEEESGARGAGAPISEGVPDDAESDGGDWDNRILCSDGNCIGVIGPDGRCTACGKPYDPATADD